MVRAIVKKKKLPNGLIGSIHTLSKQYSVICDGKMIKLIIITIITWASAGERETALGAACPANTNKDEEEVFTVGEVH